MKRKTCQVRMTLPTKQAQMVHPRKAGQALTALVFALIFFQPYTLNWLQIVSLHHAIVYKKYGV